MAKKILIIVLLTAALSSWTWGAAPVADDRVRLFEKYDFKNRQFTVVGITWGEQRHKIQDELGNFYTDDIKVLEEIKQQWITEEQSPMFACGYHYTIFVLKDGKEVESFSLNLEEGCNTIATEHGHYFFDPQKLASFIGKLKKPRMEKKSFRTLTDGRAYVKSLSGRSDLLMSLTPAWIEYDGEFRFDVDCNFGSFDSNRMQQCVNRVEKQIHKKYPGEKFALDEAGSSVGQGKSKIMIRMKCSKALYEKFNLYKTDWEWTNYSPEMTVLWK